MKTLKDNKKLQLILPNTHLELCVRNICEQVPCLSCMLLRYMSLTKKGKARKTLFFSIFRIETTTTTYNNAQTNNENVFEFSLRNTRQ